jgi:hypothetical protein
MRPAGRLHVEVIALRPLDDVHCRKKRNRPMSVLVVSAIAAAALAAVPPSLGSEPIVVGFDYVAPPTPATVDATTLASSVGSEPMVVSFDDLAYPAARRHVAPPAQQMGSNASSLAASLGSEPVSAGFHDFAGEAPPPPDGRRHEERLACNCPCG